MFGKNKILKPENHDGSSLAVQEIFATFQGEGPFVGYPSVFVRLGGCNLACDFCDTEFDSFASMSLSKIITQILQLAKNETQEGLAGFDNNRNEASQEKLLRNLVVITGGEPLRQPIERLCKELIEHGFLVQIETNGTLFRELPPEVKIICSPKNVGAKHVAKDRESEEFDAFGYHKIRGDLLARLDAIKFIISASKLGYQGFADVGQSIYNIPVYLQPMDEYDVEKNRANMARVLELAARQGARVSLQMHKILGIS